MVRPPVRLVAVVLALISVSSAPVQGQSPAPGDSVRLSRYEGGPVAGAFVARTDGLWTLVSSGDTVRVQDADLWRRELRIQRNGGAVRSQRRAGASPAGALVAGGIVYAATDGLARLLVLPAMGIGALYGAGVGTVATIGVGDWYWQVIP